MSAIGGNKIRSKLHCRSFRWRFVCRVVGIDFCSLASKFPQSCFMLHHVQCRGCWVSTFSIPWCKKESKMTKNSNQGGTLNYLSKTEQYQQATCFNGQYANPTSHSLTNIWGSTSVTLFFGRSILTRSTHHAPKELAWSDVWDGDFRLLSWKRSSSAQSSLNWSMHVLCGAEGPPVNCRSYALASRLPMEKHRWRVFLSVLRQIVQTRVWTCQTLDVVCATSTPRCPSWNFLQPLSAVVRLPFRPNRTPKILFHPANNYCW